MRNSYHDVGQRFGLDPDLSDADIQMRLEELKEVHFLFPYHTVLKISRVGLLAASLFTDQYLYCHE